MDSQLIGATGLMASRMAYGCMRISGTWNPDELTREHVENGKRALRAAYEAGYTLFDHADIYGRGTCETIHGELLRESPSLRDQTIIATKCGSRFPGDPNPDSPHRYDFSKAHIIESCEKSLQRLGVDVIDIYQLHRPDLLMDPSEVAEAFDYLHEAGKVRHFGVSNFLPSFVAALAMHLDFPIAVNQVEIHLGRLDCFYDGTLDQCLEFGITPLSWSPLGGGWLGAGRELEPDDLRRPLLDTLDEIAAKYEVSRTVMALAWLMRHPSGIVPIVGSTKPENIADAARADGIEVEREDWYRLLVAARGAPLP